MAATLRKSSNFADGLSGVRYTPTSAEEDPEDSCSDTASKLAFVSVLGVSAATTASSESAPMNGDVIHSGRSSTAATSPPVSATLLNSTFPYYDYQDTDDNESEGGGCDSMDRPSPTRLPNGIPHQHSTPPLHQHHHNNNHHPYLGEKVSADSSELYHHQHHLQHHQHRDSRILRELSKSSLSRRSRAEGKGRCLCCMMCIFLLSTAGLGALLALIYAGKVELAPAASPSHTAHSNGGGSSQNRRPGEDNTVIVQVQKCETRDCMETAAAILGRMNTSVNPCDDFYSYACGGYNEKTYLSWFRTRVRENPEEIIQQFRRYAIDRLSSSYTGRDGPYVTKARTLFRSCLFRPQSVDDRLRTIVASVVESLGGLLMPDSGGGGYDLTPLVVNVTRLYGASPFFKIHIRGPKKVAIKTRPGDYKDPLESAPHVLSRSVSSRPGKVSPGSEKSLEELLLSLLARVNYTGDMRQLVRDFLRLQANIRRTFNEQNWDLEDDDDGSEAPCDEFSRSSFAELQFRHGTYGLNWTELVLGVLDLTSARDVVICEARLSRPMQHLLEITPPQQLWQFAILHTLLHSDLFLMVSGRRPRGRDLHPFSFRSSSSSSSSDSAGSGNDHDEEDENEMTKPSPEEQCLDLLDYVMPSLKSSLHCDTDALSSSARQSDFLLEHLRVSLFVILKDLFHISADSSWRVTNTTVNRVKMDILFFLKSLEVRHEDLRVELDEYDFSGNLMELIKYRNLVYFQGKVHLGDYPDHVTAFGIRACFEDSRVSRPGPQMYHTTVPYALRFGSLGTYLASQIAEKLGIEDLLDHYSDGVLNHSAVLGLAVRLQCFVEKYSTIQLLDYGSQSYKVNGESNRVHLWKDQLALQMISKAWGSFHRTMSSDQALPGLTLSRDQLFYLAHAQTHCEKVSERGILQHYVNKDHPIPNKHRVNGPLQNLHDFYRVFQCGSSKHVCDLF